MSACLVQVLAVAVSPVPAESCGAARACSRIVGRFARARHPVAGAVCVAASTRPRLAMRRTVECQQGSRGDDQRQLLRRREPWNVHRRPRQSRATLHENPIRFYGRLKLVSPSVAPLARRPWTICRRTPNPPRYFSLPLVGADPNISEAVTKRPHNPAHNMSGAVSNPLSRGGCSRFPAEQELGSLADWLGWQSRRRLAATLIVIRQSRL